MGASEYNFSIEKGTSFLLTLRYKNANGQIVDITDYCARIVMTTDLNTVLTFSTDNVNLADYNFVIDGPQGLISWMLPAATTETFNFHLANYDFELQSPNEIYPGGGKDISRIIFGTLNIIERHSELNTILDCNNG
jgi:hypothetical protein